MLVVVHLQSDENVRLQSRSGKVKTSHLLNAGNCTPRSILGAVAVSRQPI